MPTWVGPAVTAVVGLVGVTLAAVLSYLLQQQREQNKEKRAAHAAWVARRRALCAGLMETVIRNKGWIQTLESVHDNLVSRLSAQKQFQNMYQDLVTSLDQVRKIRIELDLEPNARLQEAIEPYGDALIAYQQALLHPFSSPWNPVQTYFGKTSLDVLRPLAYECDARTRQLQDAVREYLAELEHSAKTQRTQWVFWRR